MDKIKAFNLYSEQEVLYVPDNTIGNICSISMDNYGLTYHNGVDNVYCSIDSFKLVLRELNQITKKELKELRDTLGWRKGNCNLRLFEYTLTGINSFLNLSLKEVTTMTEFLLKKGFNMPLLCLDGKTPIEAKIAIEKQKS